MKEVEQAGGGKDAWMREGGAGERQGTTPSAAVAAAVSRSVAPGGRAGNQAAPGDIRRRQAEAARPEVRRCACASTSIAGAQRTMGVLAGWCESDGLAVALYVLIDFSIRRRHRKPRPAWSENPESGLVRDNGSKVYSPDSPVHSLETRWISSRETITGCS